MKSNDLDKTKKKALFTLEAAHDDDALERWRLVWLGRRGLISSLLRGLKDLADDEKRVIGPKAQALRDDLTAAFDRRRIDLRGATNGADRLDVTAPGHSALAGHHHPLTLVRRSVERYFQGLGFAVIEGPEAETEYYNFDALNIPADHPARDMWDTLWLRREKGTLLRTHTSPMQVRYMENNDPPFRIIVPGRTFRHEATDATHSHTFDQVEGLMVGHDVTLGHFKYIVEGMFKYVLGLDAEMRLRPAYFPFTEPSIEVEVHWRGAWLEMMGAGMVNQRVFEAVGYERGRYQGFAFGMGLDRLAMVKYNIDDIRLFYENDLRFLEQF